LECALHNLSKIPKAAMHRVAGFGHDLGGLMMDTRSDDMVLLKPLVMK